MTVPYNNAYKGSAHIGYIYKYGKIVKKIYKGSNLVYRLGFDPITFTPSSDIQQFSIPLGVTKIHVDCVASSGYGTNAGLGGRVECDLDVTGGQTLYIVVGGVPTSIGAPQYGASDIRTDNTGITDTTSLQSRLIVAGAGGSTLWAGNGPGIGGAGGGLTGNNGGSASGFASGGGGGTQSAGGGGGSGGGGTGGAGTLGLGGLSAYYGGGPVSGTGGAGYYGGGGGGWYARDGKWFYAGGGGGSSYTGSNCSNVVHTQGYQNGDGYVTISFVE